MRAETQPLAAEEAWATGEGKPLLGVLRATRWARYGLRRPPPALLGK
ncbi:MAG TPA: hypothetical protein VHT75_12280 [Acidimicrobiales bacterium]|nr:hypothetical protein [Acidimicrobiales bacterium]